jgi:D-glycerate 3-kinase
MLISEFIRAQKLPESFLTTVQHHFIPLANEINLHHNSANKPYFVGVNGCQGSGKSTLSEFLKVYIEGTFGKSVEVMSLDDFYFDQTKRTTLANEVHPLLITRGVPGTPDTQLAKEALQNLKQNIFPVNIPRFNKATDNPKPKDQWTVLTEQVDIVIFEGWCWGVQAQPEVDLINPVNELEREKDPKGVWRMFVNQALTKNYHELYSFMDKWVMFKAPSFGDVYAWRLEQEQKLLASLGENDKSGVMSPAQIMNFIQHYQRLTEHCLQSLPPLCDHVFELNKQRQIIAHQAKA